MCSYIHQTNSFHAQIFKTCFSYHTFMHSMSIAKYKVPRCHLLRKRDTFFLLLLFPPPLLGPFSFLFLSPELSFSFFPSPPALILILPRIVGVVLVIARAVVHVVTSKSTLVLFVFVSSPNIVLEILG